MMCGGIWVMLDINYNEEVPAICYKCAYLWWQNTV